MLVTPPCTVANRSHIHLRHHHRCHRRNDESAARSTCPEATAPGCSWRVRSPRDCSGRSIPDLQSDLQGIAELGAAPGLSTLTCLLLA